MALFLLACKEDDETQDLSMYFRIGLLQLKIKQPVMPILPCNWKFNGK